jgi:hypothetical protein
VKTANLPSHSNATGLLVCVIYYLLKEVRMKLKLLVAAIGVALSGVAIADSYQAEVSGGVSRTDHDFYSEDLNRYDLDGIYYFKSVKTDNLPLAEAAYLGKNSNVFAGVIDQHLEHSYSSQSYNIGAEFYIPENFLYVKAGIARHSFGTYRDNDWFTEVGITPIEGLRVTTQYYHDAGYDANIHAKYVTDVGAGQFINVEAGVIDTDFRTEAYIGGDYYFDNTFSVGAEVRDDDAYTEYTLRTRKFFTETFSGNIFYTDADIAKTVGLGLAVRF